MQILIGGEKMVFKDKYGHLLMQDEVDELEPWEIEEKEIHVCDDLEI